MGMAAMALALLATPTASAGLRVDDPSRCIPAETLELDLRAVLGDERFDDVDIRVVRTQDRLDIRVLGNGREVWAREIPVTAADCPHLPRFVALSIEQGLASIPAWNLEAPGRPPELGFVVSATLPWAVRVGIGGSLWLAPSDWLRWDVQPDAMWSALERFGDGGAQMAGFALGTGPGLELRRDELAARLSVRLSGGIGIGVGRGFSDGNYARTWPRLNQVTDLGLATGEAIRVSLRAEIPILRVRFTDLYSGEQFPEPALRLGVAVSLAGSLARADGGRAGRP